MPAEWQTPWRSSSMRNARSVVITVCNEAHVPIGYRQRILNEVAELEHLLHVAEDAAIEAENRRKAAAARVAEQDEILVAVQAVLRDGRQAEVARRALGILSPGLRKTA